MRTTLSEIRKHQPCKDGWEQLLRHLNKTRPDDEPLPLETILDANGLGDALWCLRAVEGHDRVPVAGEAGLGAHRRLRCCGLRP